MRPAIHTLTGLFIASTLMSVAVAACLPDDDDDTPPAGPICPGDDEVRYVSTDPDMCARIRFTCNPGEIGYSDPECGCGCELPDCPVASDDLTYMSDDPNECMVMRFACPVGFSHWNSDCGCGCERDPAAGVGEACGGIMGIQCDDGLFCAFPSATRCGSGDQVGTCAERPDACITLYKPVCGCDGQTYSNSCAAASAGVSVLHDGECGSSGTAR
jgi:hypothetical protein